MPYICDYKAQLANLGTTRRERDKRYLQDRLEREKDTLVAYKECVRVNGRHDQQLFLTYTEVRSEKNFQTLPGETLCKGDVLVWHEAHWIVTEVDIDDEVYCKGRIKQCNRMLYWQNPDTLDIVGRWCIIKKPYTTSVTQGNEIDISKGQYKIILPYDEETAAMDLDRRLLVEKIGAEPKAYKITNADPTTDVLDGMAGGLVTWTVQRDQYNPQLDNAVLMVADYVAASSPEPDVPATGKRCEIEGATSIYVDGTSREYTAHFYDQDGNETTTETPAWTVTVPEGCKVRYALAGGKVTLTPSPDYEDVGTIITLALTNAHGTYLAATKRVEVKGLI